MKALVSLVVLSVGALGAAAAGADANIANACVHKVTGAVRFVDDLRPRRQACMRAEAPAFYRKEGRIVDSAGQFIGYGNFDNGRVYRQSVFIPALGRTVYVMPAASPATGLITDVSAGTYAGYETYRSLLYAQENCQGTAYLDAWNEGSMFLDPETSQLMEHKGAPQVVRRLSYRTQDWDWTARVWRNSPCTNRDTGFGEFFVPLAPRAMTPPPINLPIRLPLVRQ